MSLKNQIITVLPIKRDAQTSWQGCFMSCHYRMTRQVVPATKIGGSATKCGGGYEEISS